MGRVLLRPCGLLSKMSSKHNTQQQATEFRPQIRPASSKRRPWYPACQGRSPWRKVGHTHKALAPPGDGQFLTSPAPAVGVAGIVHWGPPPQALHRAAAMVSDPAMNAYGPDEGLPLLRDALRDKVVRENGLKGYDIHVTSGANQAFANVVIALLDAGDRCVLFSPFYFNHRMALQMTGGGESIVYGPCDPHVFHPDMDWLQAELAGPTPPKMVVSGCAVVVPFLLIFMLPSYLSISTIVWHGF